MNWKLFDRPLGDDMSPFGSSCKRWPAALIAAGGLLSSGVNALSQKSANATNLEAVREQNAANLKIARENNYISQAQFNTNMKWLQEQFYKQREFELENRDYSSPSAYVARLRAAGINPAFGMQGLSFGGASSSVSGVGAPSPSQLATAHMEAGHVDPVQFDFTGVSEAVGHSINAYYQNRLINEQTRTQEADTQIRAAQAATAMYREINNLRIQQNQIEESLSRRQLSHAEREKLEADRDSIRQQINYFNDIQENLKQKMTKENNLLDIQYDKIKTDIDLNKVELVLRPALARANIRLSRAQEQHFMAQLPLIGEQLKTEIQEGKIKSREAARKYIENQLLDMTYMTEKQKYKAKNSSKAAKVFYGSFDLIGDVAFGNILKYLK